MARSAAGLPPSHALLALQRAAGNTAVARAVSVQRDFTGAPYIEYEGLTNGCGTRMRAELHPGKLATGGKPSVRPKWWPHKAAVKAGTAHKATAAFFRKYMVQGHLLNEHVGGPGNTMDNLTPLSKSANSAHHAKVEKYVKDEALNLGHVVEYDVTAKYKKHPTGKGLGAKDGVAKDIDTTYGPLMAGTLRAEYTVYQTNGKELYGDAWEIENEGRTK